MNCDVIGFIALDQVLRFFFGGVASVAFEFHFGNDFLHDSAAHSTCFRVPLDVVATLERLGHLSVLPNGSRIAPSDGQEKSAVSDAFNIMKNIVFQR